MSKQVQRAVSNLEFVSSQVNNCSVQERGRILSCCSCVHGSGPQSHCFRVVARSVPDESDGRIVETARRAAGFLFEASFHAHGAEKIESRSSVSGKASKPPCSQHCEKCSELDRPVGKSPLAVWHPVQQLQSGDKAAF